MRGNMIMEENASGTNNGLKKALNNPAVKFLSGIFGLQFAWQMRIILSALLQKV